jgi:hypothetical protein
MRISLLLQREPFGEILERTLNDFLTNLFQKEFSVKWQSGRGNERATLNGQEWICNPYINAIFVPGVDRKALLPVIKEFSRSLVWWRRPLQKGYVELAGSRFFSRLLAQATINISPVIPNHDALCFLGGNHHLRLLDSQKGINFVIRKFGSNNEFLTNEIKVRQQYEFLPAPRIFEVAHDKSWYNEELIFATAINRLEEASIRQTAVEETLASLIRLYEITERSVKTSEYVSGLVEKITSRIEANPVFSADELRSLLFTIDLLQGVVFHYCENEIPLVQSHGDFQPANILYSDSDKKNWLIDWEYTDLRQPAYDSLVFSLASRHPHGLNHKINRALSGNHADCEWLLSQNNWVNWNDPKIRRACLALFLLEELDLKSNEMDNSLFIAIDPGFPIFLNEVKVTLNSLNRDLP